MLVNSSGYSTRTREILCETYQFGWFSTTEGNNQNTQYDKLELKETL